jgi:triphosphoribosyl-dephospho-CoA synthetase
MPLRNNTPALHPLERPLHVRESNIGSTASVVAVTTLVQLLK